MQYRELGRSGIQASVVAFGAWAIGGGPWWGESDDQESLRAIGAALDAGINLIDTAPVYGFGRSEELVGRAIAGRRDEVVLSTKCGLVWDTADGTPFFEQSGYTVNRCLEPASIRKELEGSLRRLRTEVIDVYHTHWPTVPPATTSIAETMGCLLELQAAGQIRAIAVSNVSTAQMDDYLAVGRIDVNQARYSLLDRTLDAEVAPYCVAHDISILAYSPLEQGLLTGKIGMDRELTDDEFRSSLPWYKLANRRRVLDLLAGWADLTAHYDCTLAQLVTACTVAQPGITIALCGARKAAHVLDNAVAGRLTLDPAHVRRMRQEVANLGQPE
ncbi:MAG: aldo/keto reductase [Fimbriimonadaceae bacterium]|nr:aldo/keto reductase [Fimbriimonadaceae bacterium]